MLINSLPDSDGSRCTLTFDAENNWLRATWRGYVDPLEAMRGAQNYLDQAQGMSCPLLLNDNVALQGPWFDTLEWLEQAWLPQAERLGLRCIAHVVQQDTGADILTRSFLSPMIGPLQLQVFHQVEDAEEWLRNCWQQQQATAEPAPQ
ncbi:hypothetical protein MUN84_00585 [Hymenobacter sp. 5516J-16]|uniref:STAS/SEC14 domain-containing protein n=1 Tax=Hymenobacter sublimis TaxID=2933777 RepID=A0ABY4JG56_9BACT|nr:MULTISPECIES: hypothetical protein [Hymenobacter]UOQ77270.1 hypothetical protein MUN84_00585 [Hymenobacter sp. 5516J-16]UPL50944.1 hypothetical protein MWH26_08575 [Hymenobacter sublimis]